MSTDLCLRPRCNRASPACIVHIVHKFFVGIIPKLPSLLRMAVPKVERCRLLCIILIGIAGKREPEPLFAPLLHTSYLAEVTAFTRTYHILAVDPAVKCGGIST